MQRLQAIYARYRKPRYLFANRSRSLAMTMHFLLNTRQGDAGGHLLAFGSLFISPENWLRIVCKWWVGGGWGEERDAARAAGVPAVYKSSEPVRACLHNRPHQLSLSLPSCVNLSLPAIVVVVFPFPNPTLTSQPHSLRN